MIQVVRHSELVKFQVAGQSDDKHLEEAHQKKGKPNPARRSARDKNPKNVPLVQLLCPRCNCVHKQVEICPTRGKRCSKCHKTGHFADVCRSGRELTSNPGGNNQQFFLGAVNSCDKFEEPWNVVLHINRKPVHFKIDIGADISVISVSTYLSVQR